MIRSTTHVPVYVRREDTMARDCQHHHDVAPSRHGTDSTQPRPAPRAALSPEGRLAQDAPAPGGEQLELFSHALAHDLREPVRSIRLLAGFISEDAKGTLDPLTIERLRQIDLQCQRTLVMVNALFAATRQLAVPLNVQTYSVSDIVHEAIDGIAAYILDHGAQVRCDDEALTAMVCVDRAQVARAVRHMITNAIQHNPSAEKIVEVSARPGTAEAAGALPWQVTITVTDNGAGIPQPLAHSLFRMFRTLAAPVAPLTPQPQGTNALPPAPAEAPLPQGTGAGLAIVRTIAERHAGRAWVEARTSEQSGSIFCMTLPLAAVQDPSDR